jgi:hypothetical protein
MKHVAILFFLILFGSAITVHGQGESSRLSDRNVTLKMNDASLGEVFEQLMVRYRIPIGFEESSLDQDHDDYDFGVNLPGSLDTSTIIGSDGVSRASLSMKQVYLAKTRRFDLDFENAPLNEVVNSIVSQMKNYVWDIKDGVINIYPMQGRDPIFERFLDVKISSFTVSKQSSLRSIKYKLMGLPEVMAFLRANEIVSSNLHPGVLDSAANRQIGIDLKFADLTIGQLLNRIARSKGGGWILKKDEFTKKEIKSLELEI